MKTRNIQSAGAAFALAVAMTLTGSLFAQEIPAKAQKPLPKPLSPEEHQAKYDYRRVQPLLDVPMIDAAITKAPDGQYYLTGTTGTQIGESPVNFRVNEGVRLWRSKDMQAWEDLGLVAPRSLIKATVDDLGLLRTAAYEDEFKGLLSPEIHFIKGGCYITYGLHPQGTGLLKSTTGKPEGPYDDLGLMSKEGRDASLFADEDLPAPDGTGGQAGGLVYWVFGGGWFARMKDDLSGLAEEPKLVQPHDSRKDLGPGGQILQVGQAGAFLFKKDGVYHMLAAGIHGRLGVPCFDTFVATAKSLEGPWSRRKLAVTHGGQSTMFEGPGGQWFATFSGVDSRAAVRERPAIVPVDWVNNLWYYHAPKGETWPWKRPQVITEAWGWENALPLGDLEFRDVRFVDGRDGYYYFSGLHSDPRLGTRTALMRGKDLTGKEPWEWIPIAPFETMFDMPGYPPATEAELAANRWGSVRLASAKPHWMRDRFWLFCGGWSRRIKARSYLLESESMLGPWKVVSSNNDNPERGRGFFNALPFIDRHGDAYRQNWGAIWPATEDFRQIDEGRPLPVEKGWPQPPVYYLPGAPYLYATKENTADGSSFIRGDAVEQFLYEIDGKYIFLGTGWHGDYRSFGTYDHELFWANEVGGPWYPNRTPLPHNGQAGFFKDAAGQWWMASFNNNIILPDYQHVRSIPITIEWNGAGYDIAPVRKVETLYLHQTLRTENILAAAQKPVYPTMGLPNDIELRAPFIAREDQEGEAVYYLTGTSATPTPPSTDRDFRNNDGVHLWKSTDLTHWESLGVVAGLRPGPGEIQNRNQLFSHGLNYFYPPPDSLEPTYDRGIIGPKLYRIGDDYWIVFSMSRQRIGLLKSENGKPEGPYKMHGPDAKMHGPGWIVDTGLKSEAGTDAYYFAYDPSLFIEEDLPAAQGLPVRSTQTGTAQAGGSVHLVFGPGWIGKLHDNPADGLAEIPRLLEIEDGLYAGQGACQIRKENGKYHLLAANEWGDLIERTSDRLNGPYGNARLIGAKADDTAVFLDADNQSRMAKGAK